MALESGALECRFPVTIPVETLERAEFFDAFPHAASRVTSEAADGVYCLSPAVCYHAYEWFAGQRIPAPVVLTAVQSCFREADRAAAERPRLWEFTMREVVLIGPPDWVTARCEEWADRIGRFAADLRLNPAVAPATDPFFGAAGRGRRLLQQVKGLKRELRVMCEGAQVALASFNRHERFFADRFAFDLSGGSPAHSGCIAFGLERWALAILEHRGAHAVAALVQE